jgi:hypothetical protein
MADKEKLNDMLDSLIDKKDEEAQIHFHNYLEDKMKEVLRPEVDDEESNKDKD